VSATHGGPRARQRLNNRLNGFMEIGDKKNAAVKQLFESNFSKVDFFKNAFYD
jgi:hypothetical protein